MMQDQRPILVFAQSARFIAESATQAGYPVWVADCYADSDTMACADRYLKLPPFTELDQARLRQLLIEFCQQQACYLICGTGIEIYYPFLSHLPSNIQLIGPSAATIAPLKQPKQFYQLIQQLQLKMPDTTTNRPTDNIADWLVKSDYGYGGTHIKKLIDYETDNNTKSHYYQRYQTGVSASACFISNGTEVQLLSVNQQEHNEQFHLCGISSPYRLTGNIKQRLVSALTRLCQSVDLRGINSIDFIVDDDDFYILEINPRISASAELFNTPDLIPMHIRACQQRKLPRTQLKLERYRYLTYVFAATTAIIPEHFPWPSNCHDIPSAKTLIKQNQPICSLLVTSDDSITRCKTIAEQHKTFIQQKLSELS